MNILLTSVGRRSYMVKYFKEALADKGQVHVANSEYTYSMQLADKYVCTPLIYDSGYVDFLLEYCKKNDIRAVISLFDIDLPILSHSKDIFAKRGIKVLVSDYPVTQICNDKWQTYNFLKSNGIGVPISFIDPNECLNAIKSGLISFPLIMKPRWGMGSIGIYEVETPDEFNVFLNKLKREIFATYLKYESKMDPGSAVIMQEKLVGEEYGIDIFNDLAGNLLTVVPKKKIAMRAGETDSARIVENKELASIAQQISKALRHVANLDVDCFMVAGSWKVLEMNCRFGGQYPFSHLAGVNFPLAILRMLEGEKVPENLLKVKSGIVGIKDIQPQILLNAGPEQS